MDWQPIDTAPKDGTTILLWGPLEEGDMREFQVAMWDTLHRQWIDPADAHMVHESPSGYRLEGFTRWAPISPPTS